MGWWTRASLTAAARGWKGNSAREKQQTKKSQPSITSCEVVLKGKSSQRCESSCKNGTRQQAVMQHLLRSICHVRKWYFHWQMETWLASKRGDLPSLMHLAFGDLGNFSFLCFCFPKSQMRVIIFFWQVMIDGLHKNIILLPTLIYIKLSLLWKWNNLKETI